MSKESIYEVIRNHENKKTLVHHHNGKELLFHSLYSVEQEALDVYNEYYLEGVKEYIFMGFGLGYHTKKFIEMGCKVTIIILDRELHKIAKETIDFATLFDHENVEVFFFGYW